MSSVWCSHPWVHRSSSDKGVRFYSTCTFSFVFAGITYCRQNKPCKCHMNAVSVGFVCNNRVYWCLFDSITVYTVSTNPEGAVSVTGWLLWHDICSNSTGVCQWHTFEVLCLLDLPALEWWKSVWPLCGLGIGGCVSQYPLMTHSRLLLGHSLPFPVGSQDMWEQVY